YLILPCFSLRGFLYRLSLPASTLSFRSFRINPDLRCFPSHDSPMRDRAEVWTIQWGSVQSSLDHLVRSTLGVIPDIHFVGFSKSMMANRPLLIKLILANSLASVLPALTKTTIPAPVSHCTPIDKGGSPVIKAFAIIEGLLVGSLAVFSVRFVKFLGRSHQLTLGQAPGF